MNNKNEENNPSDRRQNNIIAQALAALAQAIENMQPVSPQGPQKQNITQIPKFHRYRNKDPTEWVKRFDAACLINNWRVA